MLLLKKHLVELVRAGKKRQTIRLWDRPHVRVGQISYTPGLGQLKITGIDELPHLDALTDADAIADGFASLPELLREIHHAYPVIPPGKRLFRVTFQWPLPAGAPVASPATTNAIPTPNPAGSGRSVAKHGPTSTRGPGPSSAPPAQTTARSDGASGSPATASQRHAVKSWVLSRMEKKDALPPDHK